MEGVVLVSTEGLGRRSWEPVYRPGAVGQSAGWWIKTAQNSPSVHRFCPLGKEQQCRGAVTSRFCMHSLSLYPAFLKHHGQHRVKHRTACGPFRPGHLCSSVLSGCEAIALVAGRNQGFQSAHFLEIFCTCQVPNKV